MAAKDSISPELFRMNFGSSKGDSQLYYEGHAGNKRVFQAVIDSPNEIPNPDVLSGSNIDLGSTELFHHVPPRVSLGVVVPGYEGLSASVSQDVKETWGEYPTIGTYSDLGPMEPESWEPPSPLISKKVPVHSAPELVAKIHGTATPDSDSRLGSQFTQPKLPGMD